MICTSTPTTPYFAAGNFKRGFPSVHEYKIIMHIGESSIPSLMHYNSCCDKTLCLATRSTVAALIAARTAAISAFGTDPGIPLMHFNQYVLPMPVLQAQTAEPDGAATTLNMVLHSLLTAPVTGLAIHRIVETVSQNPHSGIAIPFDWGFFAFLCFHFKGRQPTSCCV